MIIKNAYFLYTNIGGRMVNMDNKLRSNIPGSTLYPRCFIDNAFPTPPPFSSPIAKLCADRNFTGNFSFKRCKYCELLEYVIKNVGPRNLQTARLTGFIWTSW